MVSNGFLANLPPGTRQRVLRVVEPVHARPHEVVLAAGQRLNCAYFVEEGLLSLVVRLSDGRAAEVGLVGAGGMVGLPLALGRDTTRTDVIAQAPSSLWRIGTEPLRTMLSEDPAFRDVVLGYAVDVEVQAAQIAACNAHHHLDQRLARWLLTAADCLGSDILPMTQEMLALMLSVQRPAVTVAARALQASRLIEYARGQITIRNRAGLEAACCECYGVMRASLSAAPTSPATR